jgi:hypothetical protein
LVVAGVPPETWLLRGCSGERSDRYEDAVVELVRAKQAGLPAKTTEEQRPSNVVNIMDALRKSIATVGGAASAPANANKSPAKETAAAPRPKAPSKAKGDVAKTVPAKATSAKTAPALRSSLPPGTTLRLARFRSWSKR